MKNSFWLILLSFVACLIFTVWLFLEDKSCSQRGGVLVRGAIWYSCVQGVMVSDLQKKLDHCEGYHEYFKGMEKR